MTERKKQWSNKSIAFFKARARARKKDAIKRGSAFGLSDEALEAVFAAARQQEAKVGLPIRRGRRGGATRHSVQGATRGGTALSAGTKPDDVWRPSEHRPSTVHHIDDARKGVQTCAHCGERISVVEIDGAWHVRSQDGLPHKLTCEGQRIEKD